VPAVDHIFEKHQQKIDISWVFIRFATKFGGFSQKWDDVFKGCSDL